MRILVFSYSLLAGGAERVISNLSNQWADDGHQVIIVTQQLVDSDFYKINRLVKRISLGTAKDSSNIGTAILNNLMRLFMLRKVFKTENPDVVISMMATTNVVSILSSRGLNVPIIACERTYPPHMPIGKGWSLLRRLTYPLAMRVIMLTSEGLDWLHREIPEAFGAVIPNSVVYPLPVSEPVINPENVVKKTSKVLLAVGRMSEEKGFSSLVGVFASLAHKNSEWVMVILGNGPLYASLEKQIQIIGLEDRVLMPGQVGNVGAWYERADLYVLSSRVEGFPNTLAEAMAHGCATLAFDCDTGPRDLIRHEIDGLLVPNADFSSLAESLERLMQNDILREEMSVRALDVRNRFSMKRILSLWDSLFADIIGKFLK